MPSQAGRCCHLLPSDDALGQQGQQSLRQRTNLHLLRPLRPLFEEPYFASPAKQLPYPPIALRVSLASSQLISYHERFNLSLPLLRRFGATFGAHKAQFSQGYAEKIAAEYMAACHDLQRRGTAAATPKSSDEGGAADGDDDEADAALDDALDAMLDAQAAAEGNLYDDFDAECVGSDEAWESD